MADPDPSQPLPAPIVSADAYDEAYFRQSCGGAAEWDNSGGRRVAAVYQASLNRAHFRPGQVIVDLGTGRGELPVLAMEQGAARAVGIEYSAAAVALAAQTAQVHGVADRVELLLADARSVPVEDDVADLVTMLDVVEHLAPAELDQALSEARRILKPGGRIFIHTFPTRTIYDITYRALRWSRPSWRRTWPSDPRNDFERLMHVNEQTVTSLRRSLRRAGFAHARVTVGEWVYTDFLPAPSAKRAYEVLARLPGLKRLAVSNIWADAAKGG